MDKNVRLNRKKLIILIDNYISLYLNLKKSRNTNLKQLAVQKAETQINDIHSGLTGLWKKYQEYSQVAPIRKLILNYDDIDLY